MKTIPQIITFFCLTAIAILFPVNQPGIAATEHHRVMLGIDSKLASVNGDARFLEKPPFVAENVTVVPLRFVSTAFLSEVNWDPQTKTAHITRGNMQITINPGRPYATVNDRRVPLQVPARIKDGTTYIPLRLLSNIMGAQINWNSKNRTINIVMSIFKHDETGISFVYPASWTVYSEDAGLVRFTGPGKGALELRKVDSHDIDIPTLKKSYTGSKVIFQSDQELWISRGGLILLNKLISGNEENYLIVYGTTAGGFEQTGRNEYELIVNTLHTS